MSTRAKYYLCLSLFKLAVGATLLIGGWDSLVLKGNPALNIMITTLLAFSPAAFAKPLYEKLAKFNIFLSLTIAFALAGIGVLVLSQIEKSNHLFLAATYFTIWIVYFLIETGNERWFFSIAGLEDKNGARKTSSVSNIIMHGSVVSGPVVASMLRHLGFQLPYYFIAISLFVGASICLSQLSRAQGKNSNLMPVNETASSRHEPNSAYILFVIAQALVWPTVAAYNMTTPIIAKYFYNNNIGIAAMFEVSISVGMASAGFFYPLLARKIPGSFKDRLNLVLLILLALLLSMFFKDPYFAFATMFAIGIVWGFCRIEMRALISQVYTPSLGGSLVATSNALSGPLVLCSLLPAFSEFTNVNTHVISSHPIYWSFPMVLLVSSVVYYVAFSTKHPKLEQLV